MKRQLRLHDRVLLYTRYCTGRVKDYQAILFIIYDNFPLFFLSLCRFYFCQYKYSYLLKKKELNYLYIDMFHTHVAHTQRCQSKSCPVFCCFLKFTLN